MGDPYKSSGKHRAAGVKRTTAARPAAGPEDTDELEPVDPPPAHKLREVLDEQQLNTSGRVAVEKLLDEIEAGRQDQDSRIARLERNGRLWTRALQLVAAVGAAGILSAIAVVAAKLIEHGDARAEARQQAAVVRQHSDQIEELERQLEKVRLQVAADHTLLGICAARLGAAKEPSL